MSTYDIIVRVSNVADRSGESFMTVDDQVSACADAIDKQRHGRVGKTYDCTDVSGWSSVDSPAYRQALSRVQAGQTAGFAFAYSTRIGRNVRKVGRYFDECEDAGADVLFADKPHLDYRTNEGRTETTIDGLMAERKYLEDRDRGNRIANQLMTNKVANRVPFGYMRNGTYVDGELSAKIDSERHGKALVPDPETSPYVVRIFEMRRDGYSWGAISGWLQAEGIKPARGGEAWKPSTLRNLIANPTYLGRLTLGDRVVEDAHKPLVSRTLFNTAQSVQTVRRTGNNAAGLGAGLFVCEKCGARLSVTGSNPAYTCRRTAGSPCERPTYVSRDRADAFLEEVMIQVLSESKLEVIATGRDIKRLHQAWKDAEAELEAYVTTAAALKAELFAKGLTARQGKVDSARDAYEAAEADAEGLAEIPDISGWALLDLDGRRRVTRRIIDRVIVSAPASQADRGPHADVSKRFDVRWQAGIQAPSL